MNEIKIDTIDCDLFLKNFTQYGDGLLNKKHCDVEKCLKESSAFFSSPILFNSVLLEKSNISEEVLKITDLYPVNICIVDFILKEKLSKENFRLLDFACGIPNLLNHLNLIGYKYLYGYDNYKQIQKEIIDEFCVNANLKQSIINLKDIEFKNITALSHVGCPISKEEYVKFLSIPTLEYIFADYRFTPVPLLPKDFEKITPFEDKIFIINKKYEKVSESIIRDCGFKPVTIYDGLLLIYKKTK